MSIVEGTFSNHNLSCSEVLDLWRTLNRSLLRTKHFPHRPKSCPVGSSITIDLSITTKKDVSTFEEDTVNLHGSIPYPAIRDSRQKPSTASKIHATVNFSDRGWIIDLQPSNGKLLRAFWTPFTGRPHRPIDFQYSDSTWQRQWPNLSLARIRPSY